MYHAIKVEQLSKEQLSKLLRGIPVRVKHNPQGPLSLKLSTEQAKKIARSYKKNGASCNITLDPYQIDQHQSLKGSGLFSDAKNKAKAAARSGLSQAKVQAMQKAREQGRLALERGRQYVLEEGLPQLDRRVRIKAKQLEKEHLRDDDREYFDAPFDDYDDVTGEGIGRFFKKVKKGLKPVVKLAKPIVNQAYKIVKPKLDLVINEGIRAGMDAAMGGSVKRGRGRPRKALGQGLYPAGY